VAICCAALPDIRPGAAPVGIFGDPPEILTPLDDNEPKDPNGELALAAPPLPPDTMAEPPPPPAIMAELPLGVAAADGLPGIGGIFLIGKPDR